MNKLRLPTVIKVKVVKGKEGGYIAEMPEYDMHTESDSLSGLDYMINDLIYAYFDVPKKYWGKIWYRAQEARPRPEIVLKKLLQYQQFISTNSRELFR